MNPLVFLTLKKPILAKVAVVGSRSLPWLRVASHSPFVSEGVRNLFRWGLKFVGGSVAVFSGVVLFNAVDQTPFTERYRLCMTSPEEDVEVGYRLSSDMLSEFPRELVLLGSHPLVRTVQQVANKLTEVVDGLVTNELPPVRIVVVSDSSTAAYSLPNGDIILHAGLLGSVESVDELAVVLAHEIAHVFCRHSAEIVTMGDLLAIPSGFLYSHVAGGGVIKWLALKMARPERLLAELPASRRIEIEADVVGVRLMAHAGFDPSVAEQYWLKKNAKNNPEINYFTSTHPSGEDRQSAIRNELLLLGEPRSATRDTALEETVQYWINRVRTETAVSRGPIFHNSALS